MKKTILKVKGNNKDEFWSEINGNALEIMAAELVLLQNIVESFKNSEKSGDKLLTMLFEDIEDIFAEKGISKKKGKRTKEND